MKTFRTAALIVVCLGLALPSTHALVLCIDSDGSLALAGAADGACTGSKARSNDGERTPAEGLGRAVDAVDCGGCTDVVLGGGGAAIPPPAPSGKHKLSRPTDKVVDPTDAPRNSTPRASCGARFSSSALIPERPPACDSVVLRL